MVRRLFYIMYHVGLSGLKIKSLVLVLDGINFMISSFYINFMISSFYLCSWVARCMGVWFKKIWLLRCLQMAIFVWTADRDVLRNYLLITMFLFLFSWSVYLIERINCLMEELEFWCNLPISIYLLFFVCFI